MSDKLPAKNAMGTRSPKPTGTAEMVVAAIAALVFAFATRGASFGHPYLYVDEAFYFAAGLEMKQGAIPFVDFWDRKPPAHFMLYALLARISENFVVYQVAATFFAAATSFVVYLTARHFAGIKGSAMAAAAYLLLICVFDGHGGQSPVFYNAPMSLAAYILFSQNARIGRKEGDAATLGAMFLAGIAISIKTTAVFEGAFFGLFAIYCMVRNGAWDRGGIARIIAWALAGALPSLSFAFWYFNHGYWDEYWNAMVTSNLRKSLDREGDLKRIAVILLVIAPIALFAIRSLFLTQGIIRRFLSGWLIAALIGFASLMAISFHYFLPLLVPLTLASALQFDRKEFGTAAFVAIAVLSYLIYPFFDLERTRYARAAMGRLVEAVRESRGDGPLLIYDGPPLLYPLSGQRFPSRLAFPNHLNQRAERNVSGIDTLDETRRILSARPGAVLISNWNITNRETSALVGSYIQTHCRKVLTIDLRDNWRTIHYLYGHCREKRKGAGTP